MIFSRIGSGLIALAALGIAAVGANADTSGPAQNAGFACGVSSVTERGMLTLEGVVESQKALRGEYRFAIRSQSGGGSSNISQGGEFSAAPGAAVSLGSVMVNAGASTSIDFVVKADGKEFNCSAPLTTRT